MSQHTPTEWEAVEDISSGYLECRVINAETGFAVTGDVVDPETGKPSKANAQLIAAAPRMLDALKAFAETDISRTDDSLVRFIVIGLQAKARAVIASAEGRAE